jgi:hypothetical protein
MISARGRCTAIRQCLARYTPDIEASASARSTLSALVNPVRLAGAIASHVDMFDPTTRAFLEELREGVGPLGTYIEGQIEKTRVFEEVDKGIVRRAFIEIMGFYNEEIDMIGVGEGIYCFETLSRDEGGVLNLSTAELLGHEFIHSIQASAFGDAAKFLGAYRDTGKYLNEFELVAYSFGGKTPKPFEKKLKASPRVLRDPADPGPEWWRLDS